MKSVLLCLTMLVDFTYGNLIISNKLSSSTVNPKSNRDNLLTISNQHPSDPEYLQAAINKPIHLSSLPFPTWLTEFTGLTEWPGIDPPYIPLDFLKFDNSVPIHQQGDCSNLKNENIEVCSFDCFNCVSSDDVYTCNKLSQTFDDGPSLSTIKLLKNLKKTKTKSTFFNIGLNIVRFPEIYRNVLQDNHIIGSHTWSHKFLPSLSNEQIVAQIEWSIWAMNATSGHLPKWFRPPYGGIDNRVRSIIRQFGMQSVLWDFDTFDWKLVDNNNLRTEHSIYYDLNKFKLDRNGKGIILEHDSLSQTVNVGIEINKKLGNNQLTIPQCVGGIDYIKKFPIT